MVNMLELDRVVTFCEDNPDKHNQSSWTCETGACIAGWAALLNGWVQTPINGYVVAEADAAKLQAIFATDARWEWGGGDNHEDYLSGRMAAVFNEIRGENPELRIQFVDTIARDVLGLEPYDAAVMFDADNTIGNIRKMTKALANDEGLLGDLFHDAGDGEGWRPSEEVFAEAAEMENTWYVPKKD